MSETAQPRSDHPYEPKVMHGALAGRVQALRTELDAEMHARAVAEAEADWRGELVLDLQRRIGALETANRRLLRIVGSRLLRRAWPAALAGGAVGLLVVVALRMAVP